MCSAAAYVSAKSMTAALPFDVQALAPMRSSPFPASLRICEKAKRASVAALNDGARLAIGDRCALNTTPAFVAHHLADQQVIIDLIAGYDAFDLGTNAFDERDFGVLFKSHDGQWTASTPAGDWSHQAVFWQIEYRNMSNTSASAAPWDAARTLRVLRLMLPCDYL
jgi:Protein of unknown function (DUF3768)